MGHDEGRNRGRWARPPRPCPTDNGTNPSHTEGVQGTAKDHTKEGV